MIKKKNDKKKKKKINSEIQKSRKKKDEAWRVDVKLNSKYHSNDPIDPQRQAMHGAGSQFLRWALAKPP